MNKDDVIRMAKEAGFDKNSLGTTFTHGKLDENLEKFAELVAAAEREACAKVCEDASKPHDGEMHSDSQWAGLVLATTIRARGR